MSTRPAEITTPYGWAELFDAIRATRAAIRWIDARIEHYRDLRDGQEPAAPVAPAEPAAPTEVAEPDRGPRFDAGDVMTALRAFVDERIELRQDSPADNPSAEPAEPNSEAGKGTEPEKGTDAMHPDEQRRRDDLVVEEQERQQRDLQSDGVLDGDENPEPGDGGTADAELDLEG